MERARTIRRATAVAHQRHRKCCDNAVGRLQMCAESDDITALAIRRVSNPPDDLQAALLREYDNRLRRR